MSFIELFLLAVGLAMDAFAVSVCLGLGLKKVTVKNALTVGLYFGIFQAGMPIVGYFTATLFAERVVAYSNPIAFVLLGFIGGKMIIGSFSKDSGDSKDSKKKDDGSDSAESQSQSLGPAKMLPLAIATSIDALAVGISFAFLQVEIAPAASFIGIVTLVIAMAGVRIGNIFGTKFKSYAEFIGGVILVLLGVKILLGL